MGEYNPHVPQILGEEWVPIRDEDTVFSPVVNVVELGHKFTLQASRVIQDMRFYAHDLPATQSNLQTGMMAVYPAGTEALSGPIQSIVIPVNAGGITGTGLTTPGASSVAEAISKPGDAKYVQAGYNSGTPQEMSMFFAVNQYPQLQGKRILNVSFLYTGYTFNTDAAGVTVPFVNPDPSIPATVLYLMNDSGSQNVVYTFTAQQDTGALDLATIVDPVADSPITNQKLKSVNLGDVNHFWSVALGPFNTFDRMPWRYVDLQRLEATAANRLQAHVTFQVPDTGSGSTINTFVRIQYAALKVTFCEEQRVIYGGAFTRYNLGANLLTMRDTAFAATPTLPIGAYTATMSWVNPGDIDFGSGIAGEFPKLNGLRELYAMPAHEGVQVNVPFPLDDNTVFTREPTSILPQLSIHTSTGPLTEVHVYGRQAVAQVYGPVTATQEILDTAAGAAATYPQVRFYARRWGDTAVPLLLSSASPTVSGTGMSVQITPPEWDALPEIIDKWKEITLRFPTPPTMGTGPTSQWRWSAVGEVAGNRWEVLGVVAPAISGTPGNNYNKVASPHQLSLATYGAPTVGDTVNLGWIFGYSPPVTATTDDQTADGVLIFSQDPPTITGVAVNLASQPVSGFTECGRGPCCIPTAIAYNAVTWAPIAGAGADAFGRVVAAGGFGTNDTNQVWTATGTATDFSVNGSTGQVLMNTLNAERRITFDIGTPNQLVQTEILTPVNATGATLGQGILLRFTDINNYYWVDAQIETTGLISIRLNKRVAGVLSNVTAITLAQVHSTTVDRMLEAKIVGSTIQARTWLVDQPKPDAWQLSVTDTSLTTGNQVGVVFRATTGNTSGTYSASVDNFLATPIVWGSYELQRMDPYTDWQTIMLSTSPAIDSFNDYEARVGVLSSYRIRAINVLDFLGAWSSTVTSTIVAPGVTMPSCGTNKRGVLIFTSNESQVGEHNLAYAMTWENEPVEDFSFIEAGGVQVTQQLDRDFSVAFHGSERGGEVFSRTMLLANAAVPIPRLANMRDIRDMAWADLAYVCVRDDIGDRWFATVIVPTGDVRRNRRLYNAEITVLEVTDTANPVDP